jgi:hypothetical protein
LLPPLSTKVKHFEAVAVAEIPSFAAELMARTSVSAKALLFTLLTACRTGNCIGAKWNEIDLSAKLWSMPEGRTKAGRPFRIPLSDAAIAILEVLPRRDGYLFSAGTAGKPQVHVDDVVGGRSWPDVLLEVWVDVLGDADLPAVSAVEDLAFVDHDGKPQAHSDDRRMKLLKLSSGHLREYLAERMQLGYASPYENSQQVKIDGTMRLPEPKGGLYQAEHNSVICS